MAAFVTILLLSNVIGAGKVAVVDLPGIGPWPFGAGILFFPVSYVIGDVLTEVYGYAHARRCIWAGFAAMLFMAFMARVVVALPPAADGPARRPTSGVRPGAADRLRLDLRFWAGEFVNSYVLARMKIWTRGGSVDADDRLDRGRPGVDSLIFYPLAFFGAAGWPTR